MIIKSIKKAITIILAFALLLALSVNALAAQDGFGNFIYSGQYVTGQFRDVRGTEWFAQYVEDAYNLGFFRGKSAGLFDPGGQLTLGEAVTLAARLRSLYYTGKADFAESIPFYTVYASYALSHGIIKSHGDYAAPVTRARFAELVYNALPPEALEAINNIPEYGVCDVVPGPSYSDAVYALYRAGILAGSDRFGTFFPESKLTRAEASAIMVRLAVPASRVAIKLPIQMPGDVIYQRSKDAVIMLETFDARGKSIRNGSGFFISDTGYAVTNLHVIQNAARAVITLSSGEVYPVRGVHAMSEEFNLVIVSIESDAGGWSFLNLADSDRIEAGSTVYVLGSPREMIGTFSDGIISNTSRDLDGDTFIQFTAPISFGSGGSPLLNALGQVIGVASSSFTYGQNLNLAVPVNFVKALEPGECITLAELFLAQ